MRLYNALLVLLALLLAPVAGIACLLRPSWRRGLSSRLGFGWPAAGRAPVLWAHAASMGEVDAIAPLVGRWHAANPHGAVVFSALTATGCEHARRLLPGAYVRTFPIDGPVIAPHVVRRVRPALFLFTENEIWPNTLAALDRAGIPAVQVSGRLSPAAAKTLARFPRFVRSLLGRVARFCVQSDEHRARLLELGVAPERIVVTGSLKGDGRTPPAPGFLRALEPAAGEAGADARSAVVVAGSTHPGEEEAVIAALRTLQGEGGAPFCILAPRHPERFEAVAELLSRRGVAFVRRSRLPAAEAAARTALAGATVLLLDTLGELAGCYHAATVAFVGGTLAPVGGHNLLEPARCGVPVVLGPHLDSVRPVALRLAGAGAATLIDGPQDLAAALGAYLDPVRRAAASDAALRIACEEGGSLLATWRAIEAVLREARGAGSEERGPQTALVGLGSVGPGAR